jgi:hypothetical protein
MAPRCPAGEKGHGGRGRGGNRGGCSRRSPAARQRPSPLSKRSVKGASTLMAAHSNSRSASGTPTAHTRHTRALFPENAKVCTARKDLPVPDAHGIDIDGVPMGSAAFNPSPSGRCGRSSSACSHPSRGVVERKAKRGRALGRLGSGLSGGGGVGHGGVWLGWETTEER